MTNIRIIKSEMALKGITQTDIAKSLGVDKSTVSGVINGLRSSQRIQEYIAKLLKIDFETLWGRKTG